MKATKLMGLFLMVILVASAFASATIQITPQEVDCKQLLKEDKLKAKEQGCKIPRTNGGGSFYLGEDQKLSELLRNSFKVYDSSKKAKFDFKSDYEGKGFGIVVGNVFKGQTKRFYSLGAYGDIRELTLTIKQTELGLNAFHLKRVETKGVLAIEFLTNLQKVDYNLVVKVPTKERVKFFLDGEEVKAVKLKSQSTKVDYYRLQVSLGGLLEVLRA